MNNFVNKKLSRLFKRNIILSMYISLKPKKYRSFKDGINFFLIDFSTDLYRSDHTPMLKLYMDILNIRFVTLEIFNVLHEDKQ